MTYLDLPNARSQDYAKHIVLPSHRCSAVTSDRDETSHLSVSQIKFASVSDEQHAMLDAFVKVGQAKWNPTFSMNPRADLHHYKVEVGIHVGGHRRCGRIDVFTVKGNS